MFDGLLAIDCFCECCVLAAYKVGYSNPEIALRCEPEALDESNDSGR